jgi:hypothetical protein
LSGQAYQTSQTKEVAKFARLRTRPFLTEKMFPNFPARAANLPQSRATFCEPDIARRLRMTLYLACIATVVCCTMGANALYKFIVSRREDKGDIADAVA